MLLRSRTGHSSYLSSAWDEIKRSLLLPSLTHSLWAVMQRRKQEATVRTQKMPLCTGTALTVLVMCPNDLWIVHLEMAEAAPDSANKAKPERSPDFSLLSEITGKGRRSPFYLYFNRKNEEHIAWRSTSCSETTAYEERREMWSTGDGNAKGTQMGSKPWTRRPQSNREHNLHVYGHACKPKLMIWHFWEELISVNIFSFFSCNSVKKELLTLK